MNTKKSTEEFNRALKLIPGGVNSPVRAFRSVGRDPIFISSAKGSRITDIDGNRYIDYVGSWGPMILGHAYPSIIEAINNAAQSGTSYGAPTILESEMAELIINMVPSVEMVRMVNSGTEATMSAIRLARGYTGKNKIVKFAGCYHGHHDSFLIKAGSGAITLGIPDSPGVSSGIAQDTIIANYNDIQSVEQIFESDAANIAAVIIEPVAANMGVVTPVNGFLEAVRNITTKHGALLIFDEVITGFRLAPGGAQEFYGIKPDITTLGKIIGGGLPVGAYGGSMEIMQNIAPAGKIYQAGTLSGNPLAMTAGITMLRTLKNNPEIYSHINNLAERLEIGLKKNLELTGLRAVINRVGSLMTIFFGNSEVKSYDDAIKSDTAMYAEYFRKCLENGIYLAPSQFEAAFISNAHSEDDIDETIEKSLLAMRSIKL
jgi:glutamate-1-semialdehyde 2,1-aminomutase